jgi:signal transduction histidine kinase
MSGIQSGKMTMEFRRTDLAEVAADAVEDMRPEAARKQITLTLSASTIPSVADPARISQLLANLISNALKFTPRGGSVRVEAGTEREAAVLTVTDTGTGIPAADLKSIFERFFRSKAATQQAIPGTGLGLTITKAIVDAHGGTIAVDSTEGHGSTFRVRLPLSPPPDSPGPDRSHDEAGLAADCPGHDHAD